MTDKELQLEAINTEILNIQNALDAHIAAVKADLKGRILHRDILAAEVTAERKLRAMSPESRAALRRMVMEGIETGEKVGRVG